MTSDTSLYGYFIFYLTSSYCWILDCFQMFSTLKNASLNTIVQTAFGVLLNYFLTHKFSWAGLLVKDVNMFTALKDSIHLEQYHYFLKTLPGWNLSPLSHCTLSQGHCFFLPLSHGCYTCMALPALLPTPSTCQSSHILLVLMKILLLQEICPDLFFMVLIFPRLSFSHTYYSFSLD